MIGRNHRRLTQFRCFTRRKVATRHSFNDSLGCLHRVSGFLTVKIGRLWATLGKRAVRPRPSHCPYMEVTFPG
jgi:hypothetical protein